MSRAFVSSLQNVSTKTLRIIYSIGLATNATAEVASMTEIIKRKYLKDARLTTSYKLTLTFETDITYVSE